MGRVRNGARRSRCKCSVADTVFWQAIISIISYSEANETLRLSLRGRTFIGARIVIGMAKIKTEDLLRRSQSEKTGGWTSENHTDNISLTRFDSYPDYGKI